MCPVACQNNATCERMGFCSCLPGYSGSLCEVGTCDPGLCNKTEHMYCSGPNTCSCDFKYNYEEKYNPVTNDDEPLSCSANCT